MHWWYFVPVAAICIGGLAALRLYEAKRFLANLHKED
jgi:hypothetical protein